MEKEAMHPAIAKARSQSRELTVTQIIRDLEFDILFGRLMPRERLVEDALIARFEVKRHAVRQALVELERMGIVVRSPNRGAAVRDFSAQEVEEIYALRALLQRHAAECMPLPADKALVADIKKAQRRHDNGIAARDPRVIDQANEEFHRLIFAACGNQHLTDAIMHYAQLSRAMRVYPLTNPDSLKTLRDEHWAMIQALEDGDRPALKKLVVQHLRLSKAAYLEVRKALDEQPSVHNKQ